MAIAVARALEDGARTVVCASTGNTAASAAAYAARAGLPRSCSCRGGVARGEDGPGPSQSEPAAARSTAASTSALEARRSSPETKGSCSSTRSTPTASRASSRQRFEMLEELGGAPDVLALPYGGGGNTCATPAASTRVASCRGSSLGEAARAA